jgi:hypothetical protein
MSDNEADNLDTQDPSTDLSEVTGQGDYSFVSTEEKKPVNRTMLVLLAVVALGGGGLYWMHARSGPSSAAAGNAAEAAAADKAISQFLDSGANNIQRMQRMLMDTEQIVEQFLNNPNVQQVPLSELQANPFRYAQSAPNSRVADEVAAKKREEERLAALKAFQGLQLQSILYGESRRACMINNTLVREGQQVEGFAVEKISPNSVVVRSGEYRFELTMER